MSDDKLIKEIKRKFGLKEVSEINSCSQKDIEVKIEQILEIEGTNPFQLCRVIGISMGIMRSMLK